MDHITNWRPNSVEAFKQDISHNLSNKYLAEKYSTSESTIKRFKRMVRDGITDTVPGEKPGVTEERIISGNTMCVSLPKTRICTYEELIAHCQVDTTVWECERLIVNKWEVGAKNNTGKLEVEPLFQVKAFFKKKIKVINIRDEIDSIIDDVKSKVCDYHKNLSNTQLVPGRSYYEKKGNILEIAIPDTHFGKLAWHEECGESYDCDIAEKVYFDALSYLLEKSSGFEFDEILMVFGNDMMNTDNGENTTTRGTPQNVDGRYQRVFRQVRRVAQKSINMARQIAPVHALMVQGNHDWYSTFCLGDALEVAFEGVNDVLINNTASPRKYYQYGRNMIMFTHGNEERTTDLPIIMAQEQPIMWGNTDYRECHIGHWHKKKVLSRLDLDESHGVRIRVMPSLCVSEDWHTRKGYIGNIRSAEAYVWNETCGITAQFNYNVPLNRETSKGVV